MVIASRALLGFVDIETCITFVYVSFLLFLSKASSFLFPSHIFCLLSQSFRQYFQRSVKLQKKTFRKNKNFPVPPVPLVPVFSNPALTLKHIQYNLMMHSHLNRHRYFLNVKDLKHVLMSSWIVKVFDICFWYMFVKFSCLVFHAC